MEKTGRYDEVIGKRCFHGLVGTEDGSSFLGCKEQSAIDEATRLSNKHHSGVLILQEFAVIRYTTEDELETIRNRKRTF